MKAQSLIDSKIEIDLKVCMKLSALLVSGISFVVVGCGSNASTTKVSNVGGWGQPKVGYVYTNQHKKVGSFEYRCKKEIVERLKDPNSIRVLSSDSITRDGEEEQYTSAARVHYTATNSYGGRIKNGRLCFFNSDGDMASALNIYPDGDPKPIKDLGFVEYIAY